MSAVMPSSTNPYLSESALEQFMQVLERVHSRLQEIDVSDPLLVAQTALFPIFSKLGHDVWNPKVIKHAYLPRPSKARYIIHVQDQTHKLDVIPYPNPLSMQTKPDFSEGGWFIQTNGYDWQISSPYAAPLSLNLSQGAFADVMHILFGEQALDSDERLEHAVTLIQGFNPDRPAFVAEEDVSADDAELALRLKNLANLSDSTPNPNQTMIMSADELVATVPAAEEELSDLPEVKSLELGHLNPLIQRVNHLKGGLEVKFDRKKTAISSRFAYFVVLSILMRHYDDQHPLLMSYVMRLEEPPQSLVSYFRLSRDGLYLRRPEDRALDEGVKQLLKDLKVQRRFSAKQGRKNYP